MVILYLTLTDSDVNVHLLDHRGKHHTSNLEATMHGSGAGIVTTRRSMSLRGTLQIQILAAGPSDEYVIVFVVNFAIKH